MAWLDDLMKQTEGFESPRAFYYWSFLTAVSAVARRSVWIHRPQPVGPIYPNMYCFLVAQSGAKKGPPLRAAQELVRRVGNTRVIAGFNSFQGVVSRIAETQTRPGAGAPVSGGSAFLVAAELGAFLISDPQANIQLTNLYDSSAHSEWIYGLKNETTTIREPCVTWLAATNEPLLRESIPTSAYKGGFIARTTIVRAPPTHVVNSFMEEDQEDQAFDYDKESEHLKEIAKLHGVFIVDPDARKEYNSWYHSWHKEKNKYGDTTGTLNRLPDTVLKIVMCVALARAAELRVTKENIEEGIDQGLETSSNVKLLSAGKGNSPSKLGEQTAMVMQELLAADKDKGVARAYLLSKYYGDFSSMELDVIIETLTQGKHVLVGKSKKDTVYTLTKEVRDAYEKIERKIR